MPRKFCFHWKVAICFGLMFLAFASTAIAQTAHKDPPSQSQSRSHWQSWRGPLGTGEAPNADPPIKWSETENVAWKSEIPGLGHSSPIVLNDMVYLTSARKIGEPFAPRPDTAPGAHDNLKVDSEFEFLATAVNRHTGEIAWQKSLHSAIPHEGAHFTGSLASASPVTDGKNVFFFFGTYGLYCLSPSGELVWKKSFGRMDTKHGHGEGSSPAVYGDTVVVNWDHEGQSFIAALDAKTGAEKWKKLRNEVTSWASPIIYEHRGQVQVVAAGSDKVRAYELASGDVIWECGGLSNNVCATPIYADGMLFAGSSYDIKQMLAINVDGARGDITSTDHVVWSTNRRTPYVPSPVLVDETLYFLAHYQGVMTAVDTKTGDAKPGAFRLEGLRDIYSSPVAANHRIYITDRMGFTVVVSTESNPEILSVNRLNERFSATAAIVDDSIFLRGESTLYCIREKK